MAVLSAVDKQVVTAAVRRFAPAPPVPVEPRRPHARGNGRLRRAEKVRTRRCAYCGGLTAGRACHGHSDLLALDPHYGGFA